MVSSTCQLPGELEECLTNVGCSNPSLVCSGGFESGGQPVSVCVYPCTETADCPDLITSCQQRVCLLKICQTGDDGNINYFNPLARAPRPADGECLLPIFTGFNQVEGLCMGTGTLANGEPCAGIRTDAGAAGLCQQGSNCALFDGGGQHSSVNLCEPVCYSNGEVPGDGPACSAGSLCFNFSSYDAYGSCYQSCTPDGGQTCAQDQFCDSCELFEVSQSVCLPN